MPGFWIQTTAGFAIMLFALWLGAYGAQKTLGGNHPVWDRVTVIGLTPRGMVTNLALWAMIAVAVVTV